MTEEILYKVGDVIILDPESVPGWDDDSGAMVQYRGLPATIHVIRPGSFNIIEDQGLWSWRFPGDIISFAEGVDVQELVAKRKIEQAEFLAKKEIEKKKKEEAEAKKIAKWCLTPEKLSKVANDVFGDNYEITETGSGTSKHTYITTHFPVIEITNSKDEKHIIRDLFVRFSITSINAGGTYKCKLDVEGARTTFTGKEMISIYSHSHLHTGTDTGFSSFCLGYSDFKTFIETLMMDPSEDNWFIVFCSLKAYVSWESLEGGPYAKIHNISRASVGETYFSNSELQDELKRMISGIPKEIWDFNGELFPNIHHSKLYSYFNANSRIKKNIKTGSGSIRSYVEQKARERDFPNKFINYKGTKFKPNVIEIESEETKEEGDLENNLFNFYTQELNNLSAKFSKNYTNELCKRRSTIFEKVRTF